LCRLDRDGFEHVSDQLVLVIEEVYTTLITSSHVPEDHCHLINFSLPEHHCHLSNDFLSQNFPRLTDTAQAQVTLHPLPSAHPPSRRNHPGLWPDYPCMIRQ
jgi:hypothetical protein